MKNRMHLATAVAGAAYEHGLHMSVFDADMTQKNRLHCYYLMGLAKLGLSEKEEAAKYFKKVLEKDNTHQNAHIYLKMAEE